MSALQAAITLPAPFPRPPVWPTILLVCYLLVCCSIVRAVLT